MTASANSTSSTEYGIWHRRGAEFEISNNTIYAGNNPNKIDRTGCIYITGEGGNSSDGVIYNNFFAVTYADADGGAILLYNNNNNDFYFNTCYNASSSQGHPFRVFSTSSNDNIIKNNIFRNDATGTQSYAMNFDNSGFCASGNDCNNNVLYTEGSNIGFYNGSTDATLANWQANFSNDANSRNYKSCFVSTTFGSYDLHLNNNIGRYNAKFGVPISIALPSVNITTDNDGNSRDATTPFVGAHEPPCSAGLTGTYTINPTPDCDELINFTAAVDALIGCGITADVTFNAKPATYYEQISIPAFSGQNGTRRVTFQSETGNFLDVQLQYQPTSANNYVVQFDNTENITFKDLNVKITGSPSYGHVFEFINDNTGIILEENLIEGRNITSISDDYDIISVNHTALNGNLFNSIIRNNSIKYGSNSIVVESDNTAHGSMEISNNSITDFYTTAIDLRFVDDIIINDNYLNDKGSYTTGVKLIYLRTCEDIKTISKNTIFGKRNGATYSLDAIRIIENCTGSTAQTYYGVIANNFITSQNITNVGNAIQIDKSQNLSVLHNSIYTNANGDGIVVEKNTTGSNINVLNNCVQVHNGLATKFNDNITGCVNSFDYNNFHKTGAGDFGDNNGTACATFAAWQTNTGFDGNSITQNPNYSDPTTADLHQNEALLRVGNDENTYFATYDDIDGDPRPVTAPETFIGADEGCRPLAAGTYTIGGVNPDFLDFNDAVNTLINCGIDGLGHVIFDVRSNTYFEQFSLPIIAGTSPTANITFQSETGTNTDVILQHDYSNQTYIIELDGTEYINFKNISIFANTFTVGKTIYIKGGCQNIIFDGNIITAAASTNSNNIPIYTNQTNDDNLTFSNNTIQRGYYSAHIVGNSANRLTGIVFNNNTIENYHRYGLYFDYADAVIANKNTITSSGSNTLNTGIYVNHCNGQVDVAKNKITVRGLTSSNYGIYFINSSATSGNEALITNNFITQSSGSGEAIGIFYINSQYAKIHHNSVNIIAGNATSRALYLSSESNISVKNNIFSNIGSGYAIYKSAAVNNLTIDNNDLYTTGTNIGYWIGTNCTDLATWQTTSSLDANSISIDPQFTDGANNDLHVANQGLNVGANLIAIVPNDIDDEARVTTTIGADEIVPIDMIFVTAEVTQTNFANVSSGSNDVEIIGIRVETYGTENPFDVTQFTLNTAGTTVDADITNAKIYFTGSLNSFATGTLLATQVSPTGTYTIAPNQELASGNNYFWLTYDIDATAPSCNRLDAQCTKVTMNGDIGDKTPSPTTVDGDRKIASFTTVTIFEDDFETDKGWTFNSSTEWERGTPTGLDGGDGQGGPDPVGAFAGSNALGLDITGLGTFAGDYEDNLTDKEEWARTPAIDCSSYINVQIEFQRWLGIETDQFDNAYIEVSDDGSAWTTVWENDNTDIQESAWSLQTYNISAVADGEATVYIRFSIGETDGSFQFCGWNIDDFKVTGDQVGVCPMEYVSSTVTQTLFTDIAVSATNQQIIGIEVVTQEAGSPFDMTQFNFNTTGSTDAGNDISQAKVYATGTSNTFATGNTFGTQASPNGNFTINGTETLAEGTNYFWLVYDIAAGAINCNRLDAESPQITMNGAGGTQTPSPTTVNGYRSIEPVVTTIFFDDFETDKGWSYESDWERADPNGSGAGDGGNPDPTDDYGAGADVNCIGTEILNGNGDYDIWTREIEMTFDLSAYTNVKLSFYRWLNVHSDVNARIRFNIDGGGWTNYWESTGTTITDNAWSLVEHDITAEVAGHSDVKIRFDIVCGWSDPEYPEYSGWNIDNFLLSTQIDCSDEIVWQGDDATDPTNWAITENWSINVVPSATDNILIPNALTNYPEINTGINASVNDMEIESNAYVQIPVNKGLTVNGTLSNDAGNSGIIIKSDATGDGSLILNTTNIDVTVERFLQATGEEWHFVASPVINAPASLFSPTRFYYYDETTNDYWLGATYEGDWGWKTATGNMNTMQGYINEEAQKTVNFEGKANFVSGGYNLDLDYTTHVGNAPNTVAYTQLDGWNMVGNPYQSAIDWHAVNLTNVNNTVYYYDDGTNNYKYYNGTGGTQANQGITVNGGSRYIPMGQGFFVKTDNVGGGNIEIPISARVHNTQAFWKGGNENVIPNLLRISVNNGANTDETVFRTIMAATDTIDGDYDALKRYSWNAGMPQIYSLNTEKDESYAINTLSQINEETVVPIGLRAGVVGEYSINFTENNFENQYIYFEDMQENITINLNETQTYTFNSEQTDNQNRFILRFVPNNLPVINQQIETQSAYEDSDFEFTFADNLFTDIEGDELTYTASMQNACEFPEWLSFNAENRIFTGTPANTDVGTYKIRLTATDTYNGTSVCVFDIQVINTNDAPILVNPISDITIDADEEFTYQVLINTFYDEDINDILTYSSNQQFVDVLPDWLQFNPANRMFTATPTQDDIGIYPIELIATDNSFAQVSDYFYIDVRGTLGVENTENNDIMIYPNPTTGIFVIDISKHQNFKTSKIEITDVTGKIIYHSKLQNFKTSKIDLSDKAKGVYFIEIETDGEIFVEKLIIQ